VLAIAALLAAMGPTGLAQDAASLLGRASRPGAAFQFASCLSDTDLADTERAVGKAIRVASGTTPDVRARCSTPETPAIGIQTIGVWLRQPPGAAYQIGANRAASVADLSRDRGLGEVDVLRRGELFAWSVSQSFLDELRTTVWDSLPKRWNDAGRADAGGPIRLRSLAFSLEPPDALRAEVTGVYTSLVDVDFRIRVTDTLSIDENGQMAVRSSQDLDADRGTATALGAVVVTLFPPLETEVAQAYRELSRQRSLPALASRGAGVLLVAAAPSERMNPGGVKTVFDYRRLAVDAGGVQAGGAIRFAVPRTPRVAIVGPRTGEFQSDRPLTLSFEAETYDLRGTRRSPIRYRWTSDGTIASQEADATTVTFTPPTRRSNGRAGQRMTRQISLEATDADGLRATARLSVQIQDLRGEIPAACLERPNLPQCGAAQRRPR
jgi:hypothetical protein